MAANKTHNEMVLDVPYGMRAQDHGGRLVFVFDRGREREFATHIQEWVVDMLLPAAVKYEALTKAEADYAHSREGVRAASLGITIDEFMAAKVKGTLDELLKNRAIMELGETGKAKETLVRPRPKPAPIAAPKPEPTLILSSVPGTEPNLETKESN